MAAQQQLLDVLRTEHLHANLRARSVRGGVLTLSSQATTFLIQSIATIALARLLAPSDFGLVAMVTAVTGFGQAFADLGLSEATIQRQELIHSQVTFLFWVNVGIGLALAMVTIGISPVLAWFYREPRLQNIAVVLSLTFVVGGLRVQHDALLKRQMRFSALAIRDVVSSVIAVPTAIIIAWRGGGYWAIVASPLVFNFSQMAISWLMVRWIPGLPRKTTEARSLISFGGSVATSYLAFNVSRSADSVLIGRFWGASPLGLYSRAYNLLMLPVRQLGTPARNVAVPTFSRLQSQPERFARYYLRAANLIMWISAPIFAFLFVAAEPVIVLTLGKRWHEAAPIFQILCIFALGQLLLESTVWLFISRGQSKQLLRLLLVISPIIIAGYVIGLPFGIKGVALSGSLVLLGMLPWILKYAFRDTELTLQLLWRAIRYPIGLSVAGVLVAEGLLCLISPQQIVSKLLFVALGFAAVCLSCALVHPIRSEIASLRQLFKELQLSEQTA